MIKYFLIYICGFDPIILEKDNIADLTFKKFAIAFLFVIILSFFSTFTVFINTIENWLISLFLAIFFSLLIINLYRLIIVTSSPNNLKLKKNNFKNMIGHYIVKFNLLLMVFFIISEPLETFFFNNNVSFYLNDYKEDLINNFEKQLKSTSDKTIQKLLFENELDKKFKQKNDIDINKEEQKRFEEQINFILQKDSNALFDFKNKIMKSNFFFKKISLVNTKIPSSYLFSIFILLIVLSPVYMIMYDANFKSYFKEEEKSNNFIIKNNWKRYSLKQEELFFESTGEKLIRQNIYLDPPFNKIKTPSNKKYLKKGTLVKWFNKTF